MRRRMRSSAALVGEDVRDRAGEKLGQLEELMIDLEEGRVGYAVVVTGGLAGVAEKLHAIPWSMLTVDERGRGLVLSVERELLEGAPSFDRSERPDLSDPDIGSRIHSHYRVKPYWEGLAGQPR